jgi:hypothetical protein
MKKKGFVVKNTRGHGKQGIQILGKNKQIWM